MKRWFQYSILSVPSSDGDKDSLREISTVFKLKTTAATFYNVAIKLITVQGGGAKKTTPKHTLGLDLLTMFQWKIVKLSQMVNGSAQST